ncbi:MAG: DUF2087 domain-containing protein [Clostridia bacterium]|nr:DUF2087 domain-containing protein [Clostridia bacterium]
MKVSELFWSAAPEELRCGFTQDEDYYICLLCDKKIEKGIIYPDEGVFYEAEKYMKYHIEKSHQSVFEHLTQLDKKLTGLSDHQNKLLRLFYEGKSDAEVQKEMGIGSSSTIRNHRFALKEKEKQAKVYLVMMELLKEKDRGGPKFVTPHDTATMVDDRYNVTPEEREKILKKYFPYGTHGPLKTFVMKEKSKIVVLGEIVKRFQKDRTYHEKEVNEILKTVYEDHVTLRRYLVEYGFMDRKADGSQYWLKNSEFDKEGNKMDRKMELKQAYKEIKTEAGIYQIKNIKNGKIYVESTMNLKTINGKKIELERGHHWNRLLQADLKEHGPETFEFEVLEVLEKKEDGFFDEKDALKKLEQKWLEKLQPYGERGYNIKK